MNYPIELNLTQRPVVVIGGGRVAARKAATLCQAGAVVRVVSPNFLPELKENAQLVLENQTYTPDCLTGAQLVFACTDDCEVNARIARDARQRGIWCNVADDPRAGDFFVPAVLRRGELTIAVGTGGAAPVLAARLRDQLESQIASQYTIMVEELQRARVMVQKQVADADVRQQIYETLCSDDSMKVLARHDRQQWRQWCERVVEYRLKGNQDVPLVDV